MRVIILAAIAIGLGVSPAAALCTKRVFGNSQRAMDQAQQEYLLCQQRELSSDILDTQRDAQTDNDINTLRFQIQQQQQRQFFQPVLPAQPSF